MWHWDRGPQPGACCGGSLSLSPGLATQHSRLTLCVWSTIPNYRGLHRSDFEKQLLSEGFTSEPKVITAKFSQPDLQRKTSPKSVKLRHHTTVGKFLSLLSMERKVFPTFLFAVLRSTTRFAELHREQDVASYWPLLASYCLHCWSTKLKKTAQRPNC